MIIWDPEKCGINDEINIADYLGPVKDTPEQTVADYSQKDPQNKTTLVCQICLKHSAFALCRNRFVQPLVIIYSWQESPLFA